MIEKVLIANRGEIALRVIRTCKALGIKTVAVYSDEDTNSMHVKQATEAYHIGEATPAKSYLNQEKILDVMLSSGADSVHPGYGFLSENDDFASLCEKNKITFIGPSADSMNLCGDKMKCKAAMLKAEVPTVPGSPGLVKDADDAEKIANDIGYPVMLKSVYGGGGRGIRIVTNDKELRDGYESVTGESIAAVGKSAILVEKFLEKTRHIEYQFARDTQGNAVHIFERECSIQRRNQKLIEQTPSPIVDEETRARVGELVVNAAHAVDYTNLGTAEFLRADNGLIVEIRAADEEVAVVSTEDSFLFARACYHLGNRHVPLQIGEGWLRIQRDHVLENMVQSLGLLVSHQLAPFEPESGAYSGQTNHSHSHSHKTEV